MKKWIRMIALLSAVGMVAIGCGSDAESPAPTTAAPTTAAPTTAAPRQRRLVQMTLAR